MIPARGPQHIAFLKRGEIGELRFWGYYPSRLRHVTTNNPGIHFLCTWAWVRTYVRTYVPSLGTWEPTGKEYMLLAAGLRHLGLGTLEPTIVEYMILAPWLT